MKVKIGETYRIIPDVCPPDAPARRTLNRFLRRHGPESLVSSQQFGPVATCVLERLLKVGVEVVESETPKGSGSADQPA